MQPATATIIASVHVNQKSYFGVPMSLRRVSWVAAIALAMLLEISCGQVYRPVVIPVDNTPPNSADFHAVFGINSNIPANPGSVLQIDVSGDSDIGAENLGLNPTHATIVPNNSRVFVASAGTAGPGGTVYNGSSDIVTAFTPAADSTTATGLGNPAVFTYPNQGLNAGVPWFCSYLPDYLTTTQTTAVYVANYGVENDPGCATNPSLTVNSTDSVALLNAVTNTIGNIAYLTPGSHPVGLVETANGQNLYVLNQGFGTVADISPTDLTTIGAPIVVGSAPVWGAARADNLRVYILTQGSGSTSGALITIDPATNAIVPTAFNVGVGADFLLYDTHLNRLYVTNPGTSGDPNSPAAVYVFSTTGGPNDTPTLLTTIPMNANSAVCPQGCSPTSVAALADGSRFYVASYKSEAACSDAYVGSTPCIIPVLTVFDAASMTVKTPSSAPASTTPSLSLLSTPQFSPAQYAVPPVTSCIPAATYVPGTTRFRMFTTASEDSSHIYVSICDAGSIADVATTSNSISTLPNNQPDTLITDVIPQPGACTGATCGAVANITSFSITSNVVTFQAANNYIPGARVAISGFSSTAGVPMNGLTLTVLATDLTGTQFECNLNLSPALPNTPSPVTDAGTGVPLAPPQSPIFLLTGQ